MLAQFDKIGVDKNYYEFLKSIEMASAVQFFKKQNLVKIYLKNHDLLPYRCYSELVSKYQSYLNYTVDIYIDTTNKDYKIVDLNDYINNFVESRYFNSVNIVKEDSGFVFEVYNEDVLDYFNDIKHELSKYLNRVGFTDSFNYEMVDLPKDEVRIAESKTRSPQEVLASYNLTDISKLEVNNKTVNIAGFCYGYDFRLLNSKRMRKPSILESFFVADLNGSAIKCSKFTDVDSPKLSLKNKGYYVLTGEVEVNRFDSKLDFRVSSIKLIEDLFIEKDDAELTRVELHSHTKMSDMDGVSDTFEMIDTAYKMGLSGIAITDHCNVQSYPDMYKAYKKIKKSNPESKFKIIYGLESYVSDPILNLINFKCDGKLSDLEYIILDLETTGLSARYDEIIEFGAIKYRDGNVVDTIQMFINPKIDIPYFISNKTNINNQMVENSPSFKEVAKTITDFIGDGVIVAHNASFDFHFLNESLRKNNLPELNNNVIDTLGLSRNLLTDRRYFSLGRVAKFYGITYEDDAAHRADYDCEVLLRVLIKLFETLNELGIDTLAKLNNFLSEDYIKRANRNHVTMLVKNQEGLKDIFQLVSQANTKYIANEPRLTKEAINKLRSNILIGSSCINNELIETAINGTQKQLEKLIEFYDYIELQPLEAYSPLIARTVIKDNKQLELILNNLVKTAEKFGKMVVVTGDAHYSFKYQKTFREIYVSAKGLGGVTHPLFIRDDIIRANNPIPDAHLKTTRYMLDSFKFLGEEKAYQYVVKNTHMIADKIEVVRPIKDDLYPPTYENNAELLKDLCYKNAYKQYGNPLPSLVSERLERELNDIIGNGFSVVYYISHLLVKKSMEDGRLVGSRGSVGSSFVATMAEITEVNPLIPHYWCPKCHFSEFFDDGVYKSGYDLPNKKCPKCDSDLKYDGQDIPFETFLGFKGDKIPDIDLNFMGDYQETAHNYIREIFGSEFVYRAGTISTVQLNTAFGYVKGYYESLKMPEPSAAYINFLAENCTGTKRTTGQHPGGIVVIPNDLEYRDFTPIQFPANDSSSKWMTTHFDYNEIHDNLLKFDILGHQDPAAMYMFKRITGIDPVTLPLNDKKVIGLFSNTDSLDLLDDKFKEVNGALGLPEFGTTFVRGILSAAKPTKVSELIAISGISHGTGNWNDNADNLVKNKVATLDEVIGCRDDIMLYLISKGVDPKLSFDIMESIRKGKGIRVEDLKVLKEKNVAQWYIDSAKKIEYLFPKAHAVAYVLMCLRVAWYKVYMPIAFYAVYFTLRCKAYDIEAMHKGREAVENRIASIRSMMAVKELSSSVTKKDKDLLDVFDVCLEMFSRGYSIGNISIDHSHSTDFIINPENNKELIPPFISVDGLGENVAYEIVTQREKSKFISQKDLTKRAGVNNTVMAKLKQMNCLNGLPVDDQLSLFDF